MRLLGRAQIRHWSPGSGAWRRWYGGRVSTYTTLIDASTLAAHLTDPHLIVVDCRFDLARLEWGEAAYAEGHVPSAVYAHLDRDLSGKKTGTNGRHPLPAPDALAATFSRLGIDGSAQVVAYDQDNGMYASRLWWLLRWMGHGAVAVLDGGLAAWTAAGGAVVAGVEPHAPTAFSGAPNPSFTVDANGVAALAADADARVVDARAPERYRGDVEPIDPVAGHIPGALNHPFQRNLIDGRFRTADDLRAEFEGLVGGVAPDRVVSYCGSGVTGCHNLLALEHAGLKGARLYPGSWSEWVADPSRPVAKG